MVMCCAGGKGGKKGPQMSGGLSIRDRRFAMKKALDISTKVSRRFLSYQHHILQGCETIFYEFNESFTAKV